jgi:hypothetical protein
MILDLRQAWRHAHGLARFYSNVFCLWKKIITCADKGSLFFVMHIGMKIHMFEVGMRKR